MPKSKNSTSQAEGDRFTSQGPIPDSFLVSETVEDASRLFDSNLRCFLYGGDCVELLEAIPDNSIHLIMTSPPCRNRLNMPASQLPSSPRPSLDT